MLESSVSGMPPQLCCWEERRLSAIAVHTEGLGATVGPGPELASAERRQVSSGCKIFLVISAHSWHLLN